MLLRLACHFLRTATIGAQPVFLPEPLLCTSDSLFIGPFAT